MASKITRVRSQVTLNPLTEHRAAVTFDGTTAILYLNGDPVEMAPVVTPSQWNAAQLRFGQWGQTLGTMVRFDGVNDYISVPHAAVSDITGAALTVEAWVKIAQQTSYPIYQYVVSKYNGESVGPLLLGMTFPIAGGRKAVCSVGDAGAYGATDLPIDTWFHLAMVYDGSFIRLYLNGNLDGSAGLEGNLAWSNSADGANHVKFGGFLSFGFFEPAELLRGDIAEVRIWSTARTPEQLIAGMNTVAAPQAGLAGIWRLDEASGVTANDVSGNANHGTLTNGPLWFNSIGDLTVDELRVWTTVRTPSAVVASEPRACRYNQYVEVDQPICSFSVNQVFWNGVNVDTQLDYTTFRGKVLIVALNNLETCTVARYIVEFALLPLYNQHAASGLDVLNVSGWGSDTIDYIRYYGVYSPGQELARTLPFRLAYLEHDAASHGNNFWWNYRIAGDGIPMTVIIDRNGVVRYWHRGYLTEAQIGDIVVPLLAESFNGEITPPQAGLLAMYPFDETTGATAADVSTNGHDAALSGTWQWEAPAFSGAAGYGGKQEVNLWWDPIADADSYNVKRSTVAGGPYTLIGNTVPHSYRDVNVTVGTPYYYKVYPVLDAVEGTASDELSAIATAAPVVETTAPKLVVLGRS